MKKYTAEELKEIIDKHGKWLRGEDGGERANLSCAYLSGAYLSCADLYGADLYGANLTSAYLYGANLSGADLSCAYLSGADLSCADLSRANLSRANLSGANLSGATKIELDLVNKFFPICCPESGAFIGWKKAHGEIIKLEIQEDALRSSAYGRKCRSSKVKVLAIENADGSDSGLTEIASDYDKTFIYRVGEIIEEPNFDKDRRNECAPGIHFFITRQEAVNY